MKAELKNFLLNNIDCNDYSDDDEPSYVGRYRSEPTHAVTVSDFEDLTFGIKEYIEENTPNSDEASEYEIDEAIEEIVCKLEDLGLIQEAYEESNDNIQINEQEYSLCLSCDNLGKGYIFY